VAPSFPLTLSLLCRTKSHRKARSEWGGDGEVARANDKESPRRMRILNRRNALLPFLRIGIILVAQKASAELLLGTDESLVSCSTFFNTPYREREGTIVHIQYLQSENPYLCNTNFDSLQSPWKDASGRSSDVSSLGLVALSGNCTLQQKFDMIEHLSRDHPGMVQFLIVIDEDSATGSPVVLSRNETSTNGIPCNSTRSYVNATTDDECETTLPAPRLVTVLSVNQKCGNHMFRYMASQQNYTISQGGPPVLLLGDDDQRSSSENWKSLLQLAALVIFSFAGSFLMAHVAFSFCRPAHRRQRRRGRGRDTASQESQAQRCLLSEAYVERLQSEEATLQFFAKYYKSSMARISQDDGSTNADNDPETTDLQLPTCAVCLDTLIMPCKVAVLPCGHPFHAECITPWLTQRQACCPLCKLVLLDPTVVEESAIAAGDSQRTLDEETGGALGGASVSDENSLVMTDRPDSASVAAADQTSLQRRSRWWSRWRLSPPSLPSGVQVFEPTDLTLNSAEHEASATDVLSRPMSESTPSIAI
jgi:Ring finger domain